MQDVPNDRARKLRARLLQGKVRSGSGAESVGAGGSCAVDPDEVLSPIERMLQMMPPEEVGNPEVFHEQLHKLLTYARPAVRKLITRPDEVLTGDEFASAEAVVIQNGSRPSLLLRQGRFAPDHPFLGTWKDDLNGFAALPDLASRVGRIQSSGGGPADFHGTGTLVDDSRGLVLTNYHVVTYAQTRGVEMERNGHTLRVKGKDWIIDFVGESGSTERNRWRVKEARLPEHVGESFAGLDAAVLQIEPIEGASNEIHPVVPLVLSAEANYATGAGASKLLTIGFPGQPDEIDPPDATVNWSFVIKTLFNNLFGLKRVAPGLFMQGVGDIEFDLHGHCLSHDATTFGGASGSLLFAYRDEGSPAFGLHFAGATLKANYAVSLHKAAAALEAIGLKVE